MIYEHCGEKELIKICHDLDIPIKKFDKNQVIKEIQKRIIPNKRRLHRKTKETLKKFVFDLKKIIRIQRWWRRLHQKFVNDTDFFTLDKIHVPPFVLVEEQNHVFQFHPLSLTRYFLKEGNFINPYNRRPLDVIELKRLDKYVKIYNPNLLSLYEEHKRINLLRRREREHLQTCQLLHEESIKLLTNVLRLVKNKPHSYRKNLYQIQSIYFPEYFQTFRQLYLLDYSMACDSISYIIYKFEESWEDVSISKTRESCHIIEYVRLMLSIFVNNILPMFPVIYNSNNNNNQTHNSNNRTFRQQGQRQHINV